MCGRGVFIAGSCVAGGHDVFMDVCLSTGGGHAWQGGMCGNGCAWQGACMAGGAWWGACITGGMHGGGHVWWGMHSGGHAWQGGGMCGGGLCMAGGMCGRGHAWQGYAHPLPCTLSPPTCGQCAGGMHPTGMHSCLSFTSSILKKLGK